MDDSSGVVVRGKRSVTRRAFLGCAAAGAASVVLTSAKTAEASEDRTIDRERTVGFWVKASRCVNCGECVKACDRHHPEIVCVGRSRRKVEPYTTGSGKEVYISTSCMHCADPSCASVCPAHAITKRADGIVTVDHDRCIGCKYCYQACPYSVPHYGHDGMDKCDFCASLGVRAGTAPRCVQACPMGALNAGWIKDIIVQSEGRAVKLEASSDPSMYLS